MVECQHCMAHGVVSKDGGLGSMSGVERLTNQQSWLFQHKPGFPVPAQTNLSKHFVLLKFNVISHDEIGRSG